MNKCKVCGQLIDPAPKFASETLGRHIHQVHGLKTFNKLQNDLVATPKPLPKGK